MSSTEIISVDLSTVRVKFKHDMNYFKEYIHFNNQKLDERKKILNAQLDSDVKRSPKDIDVLVQIYDDDFKRIPAYFYHSSIISLFSILEYSLNQISNEIILTTKIPIQLKDLSGTNIVSKSRTFLSKICSIEMPTLDTEWMKITQFQRVRNLIVHHNSHLELGNANNYSETNDYKVLRDFKGVDINLNTGKFLLTNAAMIETFFELINTYVNILMDEVSKKRFKLFGLDFDKYEQAIYYRNHPERLFLKSDASSDSFIDDLPF